jgi:hypothetical protein
MMPWVIGSRDFCRRPPGLGPYGNPRVARGEVREALGV